MTKLLVGGILIASAMQGPAASQTGTAAPDRPSLVLVISIDQMRYDYLVRFRPLFQGGLLQVLDQGATFTEARYRHAATETGPGHSVILSGRSPRYTGIVANDWYDPIQRKMTNVVDDPTQAPLGGEGRAASPANLVGFTFGDALKKSSPGSRVVGVSLKDRAAILMAGRHGDAAYWYETKGGRFITSTYYFHEAPAWLDAWNARRVADAYAGRSWTRLLPDVAAYEKYAGPDAVEGESDRKDIVFPHVVRGAPPSREFYDAFRASPFADEVTLDLALAAMDAHQLGRRGPTDILAVGFSATDVIGHTYGPDSQELMDQILRLDRLLAKLFAEVERRLGAGHTLVVLTADHGVMPLVEVLRGRGVDARRVKPDALRRPVDDALARAFPKATGLIANYDAPNFVLDLPGLERQGLSREAVEATASQALLSTGLVDAVYTHRQMAGDPPAGDDDFELFRNGFFAPRSPHLIVRLKPYLYLDDHGGGTGHGTAQDYDRHVPIIFRGPGVRAGTYPEACGPEDIAPTLGLLLGLDYPAEEGARLLSEMMVHHP